MEMDRRKNNHPWLDWTSQRLKAIVKRSVRLIKLNSL
jgi:hypothetical protein